MKAARIAGLGAWLPEEVRENSAWPGEFALRAHAGERDLVEVPPSVGDPADRLALEHLAREAADPFLGTVRRRVAAPDLPAPEAEAAAGQAALHDASLDAGDIDAVLSYSAVPEFVQPPGAAHVAHRLGATRARAYVVDAASASTIAQLEVAAALIEAGRARHVLVTQSHLVTRMMPLRHPVSPNLGDAATAFVVSESAESGVLAIHARSHGEHYRSITYRRKDLDAPWWRAGDDFYLGTHDAAGAREIMSSTVRFAAQTIAELLTTTGVSWSSVDVLASVQPRRWVPSAIGETLGGGVSTPDTFTEFAHIGGCGVLTNLIEARRRGALPPGALAVLYAQGAGFTRGAALVRFGPN